MTENVVLIWGCAKSGAAALSGLQNLRVILGYIGVILS